MRMADVFARVRVSSCMIMNARRVDRYECIAGGACEPGFPTRSLCGRVRERYGSRRQRLLDLSRLLGCLGCLGGRQGSPQLLRTLVSHPKVGSKVLLLCRLLPAKSMEERI